jgi:hypothetical protein
MKVVGATSRIVDSGESNFNYEGLREFEAEIAKASKVV